jgi:hypothetical protein
MVWAVALSSVLIPLGMGATPQLETKFEASALARSGVHGRDLAIQVASGRALGLRSDHRRYSSSAPPNWKEGFVPLRHGWSRGTLGAVASDRDQVLAAVPEPSSAIVFGLGVLIAGAWVRKPSRA